jgi:EAL domain-containing protein (putative c-di-GMP-specific phosphodiesterase class I)
MVEWFVNYSQKTPVCMSTQRFNLQWHQHDHYWIGIFAKGGNFTPQVGAALKNAGMQFVSAGAVSIRTGRDWKQIWDVVYSNLKQADALSIVSVGLAPGDMQSHAHAPVDHKTPAEVQMLAESLWLGDALMEDRVLCYLQPVVSSKDRVFGYESFARVKMPDGNVVGGDAIIAASKALGIEYMIDRMLHVQAIKTFVSSNFNGFLFVNFFPGFIHRPAVYLEGLTDAVKTHGIIAQNIVLEFTKSETPRDLMHLRSVCEYGRSRGYSIALDDIGSIEGARKLVSEVRPNFVKIDMHLARRTGEPRAQEIIRQIVDLAHASGGTVIGEGIETEENHQQLKALGVDLFQGYLFSPPVPVEKAIRKSKSA